MDLYEKIQKIEGECLRAIEKCSQESELLEVHNLFFSKKGLLSEALSGLREILPADRPRIGALANATKIKLEQAYQQKQRHFETQALDIKLKSDSIDMSLPSRKIPFGSLHPVTLVMQEVISIFKRLCFEVATGPEVEKEFYNFDALNMPEDHPARDMQDTFYIHASKGVLLRTHTSPVQIRTMLSKKQPPVRIISPGATFRSDFDLTHSPMFHQVEGLYVDECVSFAELKGCLLFFVQQMFGPQTKVRFRPSFFPFVEPGAEVDITCVICKGQGCRVCKQSGWLEILGAGMVHPKVFEAVQYDPKKTTGFAFGMGIERIAMLKFGIPDLRMFFENDIRFLKQFGV